MSDSAYEHIAGHWTQASGSPNMYSELYSYSCMFGSFPTPYLLELRTAQGLALAGKRSPTELTAQRQYILFCSPFHSLTAGPHISTQQVTYMRRHCTVSWRDVKEPGAMNQDTIYHSHGEE